MIKILENFRIFLLSFLLLACPSQLLWAETLTLVTYYPSPHGAYNEIFLSRATEFLASPCEIGTMYISPENKFMCCQDDGTGKGGWTYTDIWARQDNYIFPTDTTLQGVSPYSLRVGFGTSFPEFKLTLVHDGGIIAKGIISEGATLSTSGGGTRLIWYPRKAAFRAGQVFGDAWDDSNIGLYSFASGNDVIASGISSTAMGSGSSASGDYATAIGLQADASGENATALGKEVEAGIENSIVIGSSSSLLGGGGNSFLIGHGLKSEGSNGMRIGFGGVTTGTSLVTIGTDVISGTDSTAIGIASKVDSPYSVSIGKENLIDFAAKGPSFALGTNNVIQNYLSVAIGTENVLSAEESVAMGRKNNISGAGSFAFSEENTVSGQHSLAMGKGSVVSANNALAMGFYTTAQAYGSLVMGAYNIISGDPAAWNNTDPLFVLGNGQSDLTRSNALTVLKNGKVGIGTDTPSTSLHVTGLPEYVDNAAAIAAGHTVGAVYRTGDILKIVH